MEAVVTAYLYFLTKIKNPPFKKGGIMQYWNLLTCRLPLYIYSFFSKIPLKKKKKKKEIKKKKISS
jgi:hypothetical protein